MKTYTIHLIRHGMTEGNKVGRYVGSTDASLFEDGIQEIKGLKEKYDYRKPMLYFSSPMKRCIETLDLIYGEDDIDVFTVDGLRECNLGDFEGKKADELINREDYIKWVQNGEAPPNGESNKEFATRVCAAFVDTVREILKSGKTESVICAHGGVIMTILAVYGLPEKPMTEYMANNGRGFTIRVTPSVWMRTGMVEVISDFPVGSSVEPDNSVNPVKEADVNPFNSVAEQAEDVMWFDVEEDEKN
ncbi:MAG: histidine phosphatase family protein [Clostridia bacterium]|nr:histidine phosphatase family protein [Clostridia bacterium]